jgi:hypothetical protein
MLKLPHAIADPAGSDHSETDDLAEALRDRPREVA